MSRKGVKVNRRIEDWKQSSLDETRTQYYRHFNCDFLKMCKISCGVSNFRNNRNRLYQNYSNVNHKADLIYSADNGHAQRLLSATCQHLMRSSVRPMSYWTVTYMVALCNAVCITFSACPDNSQPPEIPPCIYNWWSVASHSHIISRWW